MKRDYKDGEQNDAVFFWGKEVERTPAHGMDTLFVVGVQPVGVIENKLAVTTYDSKHIFFGANHSFNPIIDSYDSWKQWEDMIYPFLDRGYLCSLDIPMSHVETFNDSGFNEYDNFIPQIRVPIPYIKLWNYNTMLKIDDKDFRATNPGVWCHSLHTLQDREKFTDWNQYTNDKVIE
jgi:hypothetical protein